jgi:hypothetical protein
LVDVLYIQIAKAYNNMSQLKIPKLPYEASKWFLVIEAYICYHLVFLDFILKKLKNDAGRHEEEYDKHVRQDTLVLR